MLFNVGFVSHPLEQLRVNDSWFLESFNMFYLASRDNKSAAAKHEIFRAIYCQHILFFAAKVTASNDF